MTENRRAEWTTTGAALCVAGLLLLGFRAAVVRDTSKPNFEFFPDMVRGPAVQSQSVGAATPDGFSDLRLPEGVAVRGAATFAYGATPEEAERAGRELVNPFTPDDKAALERGATIYARCCVPCHGSDGAGGGPAVARGMLPPPALTADRARTLRDGQLFHILTRGQGNMASYAVQVRPEDRWKAILHVRALQTRGAR